MFGIISAVLIFAIVSCWRSRLNKRRLEKKLALKASRMAQKKKKSGSFQQINNESSEEEEEEEEGEVEDGEGQAGASVEMLRNNNDNGYLSTYFSITRI